ncbi:unnamed protein product [Ixodes pacificus]
MWPQESGLSRVAHRPRKPIRSPFTMHTTRTHSAEKEGCSSEIPIARRRSRGRGPRLLLPLLSVADARRRRGFIGLAVGQAGRQPGSSPLQGRTRAPAELMAVRSQSAGRLRGSRRQQPRPTGRFFLPAAADARIFVL